LILHCVRFDGVNFIPKVSQSAMVSPLPRPVFQSPYVISQQHRSSQHTHTVFDKLPLQYVALIIENNTEVFGEISRTTVSSNVHDLKVIVHEIEHSTLFAVLRDTDGFNNKEEENSHDNVALFAKSPLRNTSGLLVSLACQGTADIDRKCPTR
ncbi:hypothetical protein H5410_052804, partial [Solanum commersonii]